MIKPILEKLSQEFSGTVDFLPINADDSLEVLEQFHIYGIPTVMALRDGKIVGRVKGSQNETGYRAMFMALADGSAVNIPLKSFNRYLRLGAGALLLLVGLFTGSWLVAGLGGLVAFLGDLRSLPYLGQNFQTDKERSNLMMKSWFYNWWKIMRINSVEMRFCAP